MLFTKTRREAPSDEQSKNAVLLIRAGYIHKEIAGVYSYLPLGLRVLNNIIGIIREEMNTLGGQEVFLTTLQDPNKWKTSGRWDDDVIDIWFKTKLKNGGPLGLANTHEEAITSLMSEHIASYKDLPRYVYQFQNKFRNETRAKSGIMRTREFIMKDLYSFSADKAQHEEFYERATQAYERIFSRVDIGERTYRTFASGGSFSKYSHEFQTLCDAGEDTIFFDKEKKLAINKEVYNDEDVYKTAGVHKENLNEARAAEVGNIFNLGTKFSEVLGLHYTNERGEQVPVYMGSYGIGPARLMGVIAEIFSDDKGLVWPEAIAPFDVHLVSLAGNNERIREYADLLYEEMVTKGISVLYDDRNVRAGEKFTDSDLLGIPRRIIIGKDAVDTEMIEIVNRATGETMRITREAVLALARDDKKNNL